MGWLLLVIGVFLSVAYIVFRTVKSTINESEGKGFIGTYFRAETMFLVPSLIVAIISAILFLVYLLLAPQPNIDLLSTKPPASPAVTSVGN